MVLAARIAAYAFLVFLVIIGAGVTFSSLGGYYEGEVQPLYERVISVGGTPFRVDVADTPSEREQGLSGTLPQPPRAMLFVFDYDDTWGIWMKEMNYPIDVLWVSADLTVTDIVAAMQPASYPRVYRSQKPVRYVLELPAGSVEVFNLAVGDAVEL